MSNLLANDLTPGSAIHPGVLIKEELKARRMKQKDLAEAIDVAKNVMSEVINGKRNISAALALKLEKALGIQAEFWMKYQVNYEINLIRIQHKKSIKKARIPGKRKKDLMAT